MPKMELVRDGDTIVSEDVDADTANGMVESFNEHAAGSYKPQEYPKWVDTPTKDDPKARSYVGSKDEEDDLHKVKGNDDFVPLQPAQANGIAGIVTPTYIGDGYGYVDNQRVSDDRVIGPDMSVPGMSSDALKPATGPVRSNAQAAIQDVVFSTGDHAADLRDEAQKNKDAMASGDDAAAKSTVQPNQPVVAPDPALNPAQPAVPANPSE